jgi:Protein of unknown function (DUF3574)
MKAATANWGKIMGTDASRKLIGWILAVTCAVSILSHTQGPADIVNAQPRNAAIRAGCTNRDNGRLFVRTELFFGRAKPDGSMVTDEEFRSFLDETITPRFPNGLTALAATGQFRGSSGMVMREGSVFVILLYPADDQGNSARIEEIRETYRKAFQQESVLRVDGESCVSF